MSYKLCCDRCEGVTARDEKHRQRCVVSVYRLDLLDLADLGGYESFGLGEDKSYQDYLRPEQYLGTVWCWGHLTPVEEAPAQP